MANSDYTTSGGTQAFCPTALLASAITRLQSTITMSGYTEPLPNGIRIGMAAMIDDEIVSIQGRSGNTLTIGRGCCDTVPATHAANARIWFFDDSIGTNGIEYGSTESVSVKLLPRTSTGGSVPVENSNPNALVMNWRFARPYPPGKLLVNGSPWYTVILLQDGNETLNVSWAHRDRITQQDQLLDHQALSVGPEIGVTYRIRVYKTSDNSLVRTQSVTGASYTYNLAQAISDFAAFSTIHQGYMIIEAMRDGLESWQNYRIDFEFDASSAIQPYGLGYRLGESLGGSTP